MGSLLGNSLFLDGNNLPVKEENGALTDLSKRSFNKPVYNPFGPTTLGQSQYDMQLNDLTIGSLDEERAIGQSNFDKLANGTTRLLLTTGTKFGEGIGYLAGLVDPTNIGDSYIAKAADNGFAQMFHNAEESVKEQFPLYNTKSDISEGIFKRAATDIDFWMDDVVDGVAFTLSTYIPGGAFSKLGLGLKVGSKSLETLGAFNRALELTRTGEITLPSLRALARGIDKTTQFATMTSIEAMFEANDLKKNLKTKLYDDREKGLNIFTDQRIEEIVAEKAKNSFLQNLIALAPSNLIEVNALNKILNKGLKPATDRIKGITADLLTGAKATELTGWSKFANSKLGSGILEGLKTGTAEGLYEENIQYSIEKFNKQFGTQGQTDNFWKTFEKVTTSLLDPEEYSDKERQKNIFLGSIIGGPTGIIGGVKEKNRENLIKQSGIKDLNTDLTHSREVLKNLYERDEEGNVKFSDTNTPIISKEGLSKLLADRIQIEELDRIANNDENKDGILTKIAKDTKFDKVVKSFFNLGLADDLHTSLKTAHKLTEEEMLNMGIDPYEQDSEGNKLSKDRIINHYQERAKKLESLHNSLEFGIVNGITKDDIVANAARKDELYYIGSQILTLHEAKKEQELHLNKLKLESGNIDPLINEYNTLIEKRNDIKKLPEDTYKQEFLINKQLELFKELYKDVFGDKKINDDGSVNLINHPLTKSFKLASLKHSELLNGIDRITNEWGELSKPIDGVNYIKKKVDEFNNIKHPLNSLEDYLKYENLIIKDKFYGLNVKKINNEFFKEAVKFRLNDPEDSGLEILKDIIKNKIPLDKETLDHLTNTIKEYLLTLPNFTELIHQKQEEIAEMNYHGEDISELEKELTDLIDQQKEATEYEIYLKELEKISVYKDEKINENKTKESIAKEFIQQNQIIFENERDLGELYGDQTALDTINKQIDTTKKLLNIFSSRADKGKFEDFIKDLTNDLSKLENISNLVTKRLNDRKTQQEKILNNNTELNYNSIGLTREGKTLKNRELLLDIISQIIGIERFNSIFTDIIDEERNIIFPEVVKQILRNSTAEQKKQITDEILRLQTVEFDQIFDIQEIKNIKDDPYTPQAFDRTQGTPGILYLKLYKENPKRFFELILRELIKNKDESFKELIRTYNEHKDIHRFKTDLEKITTSFPESKYIKSFVDFHLNYLPLKALEEELSLNINFDIEEQLEIERDFNIKEITPSNEQLIAIRELVKFLTTSYPKGIFSNFAYLKGFAGTGKTSLVMNWVINSVKNSYKFHNIYSSGHSEDSAKTLQKIIQTKDDNTGSIEKFLDQAINNPDSLKDVNLLIVDEIGAVSTENLLKLGTIINDLNNNRVDNQIKVIVLGDPNQTTADGFSAPIDSVDNFIGNDSKYDHSRGIITIKPLTIRYRSNVSSVVELQDKFLNQRKDLTEQSFTLKVNTDDFSQPNLLGTYGIKTIGEFKDKLVELLKLRYTLPTTKAIIVSKNYINDFKQLLLDNNFTNIEVLTPTESQGKTIDEVYTFVTPSQKLDNPIATLNYNKEVYTATSRAVRFLMLGYFDTTNTVNNESIQENKDAQEKDLKEAKDIFTKNNIIDSTQANKHLKDTEEEPLPVVKKEEKDEPVDDEDGIVIDEDENDENDIPEYGVFIPQPPSPVKGGPPRHILNFTKQSSLKLKNDDGSPVIQNGDEILYIVDKENKDNHIKIVKPLKDGSFIEIGRLSPEELSNPTTELKDMFNTLSLSLNNSETKTNVLNGKLINLETAISAQIVYTQKLTYVYDDKYEKGLWEDIKRRIMSIFVNRMNTYGSKLQTLDNQARIKIFNNKELDKLKEQGKLGDYQPIAGIPYLFIEDPVQNNSITKNTISQFIQLSRKKLNIKNHSYITEPIKELIKYTEEFDSISPLQFGTEHGNKLINYIRHGIENDLISPKNAWNDVRDIWNAFNNTEKIKLKELGDKIDSLIFKDAQIESGHKVKKRDGSSFQITDKDGKIKDITLEVYGFDKEHKIVSLLVPKNFINTEKYTIVESPDGKNNLISFAIEDLLPTKRTSGPAQAAFNAIAGGNLDLKYDGKTQKILRTYRRTTDSKLLITGKSLLTDTKPKHIFRSSDNKVLEKSLEKFLKYNGYTKEQIQSETLLSLKTNNPDLYNKFKDDVMSAMNDYFINTNDLRAIITEDNEGNSFTNLRVPLDQDFGNDRWVNKFMHSTGVKQDPGDYIESSFKDIIPTTIITQFPNTTATQPDNNLTSNLPSSNKPKKPKFLEKKFNKAETLGTLLSTKDVLVYLKSKIKGFKDTDLQIIEDLQMIKLSEGKEAWGLYKDKIIYLLKNGNNEVYSQVIKHELFHKIFNEHLSLKEQQKALKLIKDVYGDISDIEAEEILSRKFQIYEKTNSEKSFFQKIFDKIKQFLSFWFRNFNDVNELFEKIEEGYFKKPVNNTFEGSRLLSRIKEDWGSVDSFIIGRNFFISKLEQYIKNYDDITTDNDFPLTRDEAIKQIYKDFKSRLVEILTYINSHEGTLEETLKDFTNTENEYQDYEHLKNEYEALKILVNNQTYSNLVGDFYPTMRIKKAADGSSIIEEDFDPEELNLQIEEERTSGTLFQDHIQEADQINHELKLSRAAKDFLSLIRNPITDKLINHKYAFVLITERLQSLNFNDLNNVYQEIEAQWKDLLHPNQIAIKNELINLIRLATRTLDNTGGNLPIHTYFHNYNSFQVNNLPNGTINRGELSTKKFIIKISIATGLDYNLLKTLWLKMDANNTLAELISTTGSLIKKDVRYGIKDKNNNYLPIYKYNNMAENSLREVVTNQVEVSLLKHLINLFNSEIATKIDKWSPGHTNSVEIVNLLLKYLEFNDDYNLNQISANTIILDFQALFNSIRANKKDENFNIEQLLKDSSNRLSNITDIIMSSAVDNTVTSYRSGDGTKRWFYTLGSFAHDILNSYFKGKLKRTPDFFSSELYKHNIFNYFVNKTPLNTIHSIINHDSMKTKDSDYSTIYKNETSKQWYERNILYNFSAYLRTYASVNGKKKYVQQFWTISNKPSPQAAEINLLSYSEINEGLKQAILSEVNRPEINNVNFDRNYTSIPGLTSEDIINLRSSTDQNLSIDNLIKDKILPSLEQERENILNKIISQKMVFHSETYAIYDQLKDYFKGSPFTDIKAPGLTTQGFQNFKEYTSERGKQIKEEITPLVDLYVKNFFVNSYHLNRLVTSDESFYKGLFDITKRMSIIFGTGNKPIVNDDHFTKEKYKIAVGEDIKVILGAEKYKEFKLLYKKEFKSSDGAGFMTSKRAANIRKGFGEAMQLGNIFKPIYFGINEQGIPTTVKYACVELTEELMNKFPELKALNKEMEDNDISEYVFESAVKVGAPKILSKWGDKINPNSILTLNNNYYRIQLNKSHEAYDYVALPTQLMYFLNSDGNNLTKALHINQLQADLIQLGIDKALKDINWEKNPNKSDNLDIARAKTAIKKLVMNSLEGLQGSESEWEYLNSNISLNFPAIVNKVLTQFTSHMSKSMLKIDFPGGGLVMQTDVGTYTIIDDKGKEQKNQKLELVITKDEYYVECYVDESLRQFVTKDGYLLGYRIPSTEKHSAVPLKVKGFVKDMKNSIIVADDIVFLHGSDFDIDVLYVMAIDKSKTEEAKIKNQILEEFIQIFTNPKNLKEMMTPISMDRFKSMDNVEGQGESVFSFLARLKGFKKGSLKERDELLYKKNNINLPTSQEQMHGDNFNGAGLTGAFANIPKAVNYLLLSSEINQQLPELKDDITNDKGDVKRGNYLEINDKKYTGIRRVNDDGVNLREIIDSFINAAIDSVKEQILNVINATDNTGNALMAMLSLGIGLNKVVTLIIQPSIIELNNHINVDTGINIVKSKVKELISLIEEKKPEGFNYKELKINTDELEKSIYKNLEDLSLDDLYMQLRVLDEFDRANEIGKALFTTSKALNVIKQLPIVFEEIQDLLDEWKKIIKFDPNINNFVKNGNNEFEYNENFPFTNTNITHIPHIKLAFEQLIDQKTRIEKLVFKHNKALQDFSVRVGEFLLGKGKIFKIAKTDNSSLRLIREEFIKYLLSDLEYTSNGINYSLNTLNEAPEEVKNSKGEMIILSGTEAWNERFIKKLIDLRYSTNNIFLKNLEFPINYLTRTKEIRFRTLSRLAPEQVLQYREAFDNLPQDIIHDFIKYSALNQGLSFGSSSYTLLINPNHFKALDQVLNNKFNELINDSKLNNEQENDLNNYLENFALQLATNFTNKLKALDDNLLRGGIKTPEKGWNEEAKTYFDLSFDINTEGKDLEGENENSVKGFKNFESFPLVITNKYKDRVYIKLPDSVNNVVYYQLIDRIKTFKIYQTNNSVEKGRYKTEEVFKNNLLVLKLRSIYNNNFELPKEIDINYKIVEDNNLKPGDIIGIRTSSDASRLNMKEMKITSIEDVNPTTKKLLVEEVKQTIVQPVIENTETIEYLSKEKLVLEKKRKFANSKERTQLTQDIKLINEKLNELRRKKPDLKVDKSLDYFITLANKLRDKFNIPYNILSAEKALSKKKEINPQTQDTLDTITHFYYKGEVIFVKEKLNKEAIFHEFSHPFIQAIRKTNPELFENLYQEAIKKDKTLEAYITTLYPELVGTPQFKEECIVTLLAKLTKEDNKKASFGLKKWVTSLLKECCELINDILSLKNPIKVSDLKDANITLQELSLLINEEFNIDLEGNIDMDNIMSIRTPSETLNQIINNNKDIDLPDNTIVGSKYKQNQTLFNRITEFVTDTFSTNKYSTSIEKADRQFKNRGLSKLTGKVSIVDKNATKEFTYDEYIAFLNIKQNTNIARGKILHLVLQRITIAADSSLSEQEKALMQSDINHQINELAAPKENTQEAIDTANDFNWLFNSDGTDEESEINRKNIYNMLSKLGINLFSGNIQESERDLIKAEVPIVSKLLGLGTTLDNLIIHSDGTLGLIDWKYSTLTSFMKTGRTMLFAKDLGIEDNSLNHYMLEMTLRALMLKEQNPDIKFREIKVVGLRKSIGFDNNDVDLSVMLNLLKTYYKKNDINIYNSLNERNLFNSSEYYSQSKYFVEDKTINDPNLTKEEKIKYLNNILIYKYNNGVANSTKDASEIKRIALLINELMGNSGDNMNELLQEAQKEGSGDVKFFKRWLGNKYSVDNKFITAVTDFAGGRKQRARKRILTIMKEADNKLELVIKEYMNNNGMKKTLSSLTLGKINLIKYASKELNGTGLFDFMWKTHNDGNDKIGSYANLEFDKMTEAQKEYATFYRDNINELDKYLDTPVYVQHSVIHTIRSLAKIAPLTNDFMARVPKQADEAIENDGLTAPLNWFSYKYHDFLDSFKQPKDYGNSTNAGIPIKYRGNPEIIEKGEHTFNAHIAFHAYVTNLIMKQEMDDVYTFAQATLTVFDGVKKGKDLVWKGAKGFLEDFIKLNILDIKHEAEFSKKTIKLYKRGKKLDKNGKEIIPDTEYVELNVGTFLNNLKSWVSAVSMWLQPVAGTFNSVLIFMLNHKDAFKGSIAAKLNIPENEINFTFSDMLWADKEYAKFQGLTLAGFNSEAMKNNKVHLMLKELNYMPNAYDYKINKNDLKGGKNPLFDQSNLYIFHAIGEEFGSITMLLAQLHHLKNEKTGKSLWDSYKVENGRLIWDGGVRFKKLNSDKTTTDITGLTDEEINRLKRVNAMLQGGYRDDERVALELYALGNWALQFKKFLPSQLENLFQSKYDDKSLGKWVKTNEKDLNGENLYEWQALVNEGRIWVMMKTLAYYATRSKTNDAYKWENLSGLQKQGIIDTTITLIFMLTAIIAFDSDDDKKFSKQERAWRMRTRRLLEDLTQGTDPRDILRSSTTQTTVLPKLMKTIDAFSEFVISGGEKGTTDIKKAIPIINSAYNWDRYISDPDNQILAGKPKR